MSSTDEAYDEIYFRFNRGVIFKVKDGIHESVWLSVGRMSSIVFSEIVSEVEPVWTAHKETWLYSQRVRIRGIGDTPNSLYKGLME